MSARLVCENIGGREEMRTELAIANQFDWVNRNCTDKSYWKIQNIT